MKANFDPEAWYISSKKPVRKSYFFHRFSWFLTDLIKKTSHPAFQILIDNYVNVINKIPWQSKIPKEFTFQ